MFISKTKASYPVHLYENEILIKRSLAIELNETEDNDFIESLIQDATELTEGLVNFDIAYTNNSVCFENFSGDSIVVANGNLNQVTNIINNDTSTLITEFSVKKDYTSFTISLDESVTCDSLTVDFITGWDNYDDVPNALKRAILTKTADLFYKERGSYGFSSEGYNAAWEKQCQQFKLL
jgi:hypothetical protein